MTDLSNVPVDTNFMLSIWNDVKEFGPSFWAFIILFTFVAYKEQLVNWWNALLDLFIHNKCTLKFNAKQLVKHQIFRDLNYWLKTGIKAIQIKSAIHKNYD